MSAKTYEVIVAGAGPVGLLLACELGLRNVSVLVLERDPEPSKTNTPWKTTPLGLRGMNNLSTESLHRRGLLEQVIGPEIWAKRSAEFQSKGFAGHFAGYMLEAGKIDRTHPGWKYKLPGLSLLPSPTSLELITNALYKRATELGVEIRGGIEVTGLSQNEDSQEVTVLAGEKQSFRSKWLVGCDGGRSKVRKAAAIDFVGTEPEIIGYTVLCELDDPRNQLKRGFTRTPTGMYITIMPGHIITMEPTANSTIDRDQPVTRENLELTIRRVSGINDISVKSLKEGASYTDRAKQATPYRKGRVLLAGDSAHIHSPLGGQGLNAGIGDAMNLGWKLAAVTKGTAPPGLLDSYATERHPIGAWVTEWTRAQVATMMPTPHSQAVANVLKDLINTRDGSTYIASRSWGVSQQYDMSDGDDQYEQHPLVGRSAPEFEFTDDSDRLAEKMRSGRGLLINFRDEDQVAFKDLAKRWPQMVDYVGKRAKNELGLRALLVRPDGIVAWVAEENPDLVAAEAALLRWFGAGEKVGAQAS